MEIPPPLPELKVHSELSNTKVGSSHCNDPKQDGAESWGNDPGGQTNPAEHIHEKISHLVISHPTTVQGHSEINKIMLL